MATCEVCGETLDATAFECSYCGHRHCTDHRLPEAHDCQQVELAAPPDATTEERERRWREDRGEKPYDTIEPQTLGTTPDSVGDPSPDVAPDGSLVTENTTETDTASPDDGLGSLTLWAVILGGVMVLLYLIFGLAGVVPAPF